MEQRNVNMKGTAAVYHDYPNNMAAKKHFITKIDNSVNVIQVQKS